jgi:hypothetical protein
MNTQEYLWGLVSEELNEMVCAIDKIKRFGLNDVDPGPGNPDQLTNFQKFCKEFTDFQAVATILEKELELHGTGLSFEGVGKPDDIYAKMQRVFNWAVRSVDNDCLELDDPESASQFSKFVRSAQAQDEALKAIVDRNETPA